MTKTVTEALRNQFVSTFHMARALVEVCPESIWAESFNGVPFWQQVFHFVYFMDFWMRESFDDTELHFEIFDNAYTPDLDAESYDGLFIKRDAMLRYLDAVHAKTARLFDFLHDAALGIAAYDNDPQFTYADIITCQIRHVMYNIGYLNGILRGKGLLESDWYAYNEPEGS